MSDLKEAFKKGWLEEDPRIVAAGLLGIFTFIFLNVLLYRSEKRKKRIIKQSLENNTAIEGKLVKHRRHRDSKSNDYEYYGTYEYSVNGTVKKYRIRSVNHVPDTIKLYFKNHSMTRVFSEYDTITGAAIAFNALAAIAVCIAALLVTGYWSI
ncbi:MAG: hypothetical protein NC320_01445 [Clostridium sp.]|nr:hypothetical protein [Clostridium sp.]MCM1547605.1 hypothetical protein [Ruminococcus sp.]